MGDEVSLSTLEHFLTEQEGRLNHDKFLLRRGPLLAIEQRPYPRPLSSHNEKHNFGEKNKSQSSSLIGNQCNERRMVKSVSKNHLTPNSREIEKDKLINIISKPQTNQSISNKKTINKVEPFTRTFKNTNFCPNDREKEKDRLAEIFASSSYQYQKPSNYQVSKNLNSDIGIKSNKDTFEATCTKNKDSNSVTLSRNYETRNTKTVAQDQTVIGNQKQHIPNIVVAEFDKTSTGSEDKTMVRIGEYSPLNPNVSPSRPNLGVSEYDERRRMVLEQRKQEYNQYLQQIQESSSPSLHNNFVNSNCHQRDMATQTEWVVEAIPNPSDHRLSPSPRPYSVYVPPTERRQQSCASSTARLSPLPRYFDGVSEKEIKENLYREELRKQIEEKNRLKEEEREKQEEEEAKIDAKIQKDLEKMKQQFEEERLQRLELAIRRKEHDDLLRQRLASEQKSLQDKKKRLLTINKSTSPREPSTRQPVGCRFTERQKVKPLNHPPSLSYASKALNDVHEVLRQPLLEIQEQLPPQTVSSENYSALDRPLDLKPAAQPIRKAKDIDVLVHKTAVSSSRQSTRDPSSSFHPGRVNEKIREVNAMLKRPLLTESFQTLPPMSPPLLHASVPPPPSVSPPIPASRRVQRTESELLEDRWKVPHVEHYNADILTRHSGNVLTQLGAFRRHLVQERMRMQQRVRDESP